MQCPDSGFVAGSVDSAVGLQEGPQVLEKHAAEGLGGLLEPDSSPAWRRHWACHHSMRGMVGLQGTGQELSAEKAQVDVDR